MEEKEYRRKGGGNSRWRAGYIYGHTGSHDNLSSCKRGYWGDIGIAPLFQKRAGRPSVNSMIFECREIDEFWPKCGSQFTEFERSRKRSEWSASDQQAKDLCAPIHEYLFSNRTDMRGPRSHSLRNHRYIRWLLEASQADRRIYSYLLAPFKIERGGLKERKLQPFGRYWRKKVETGHAFSIGITRHRVLLHEINWLGM